VIDSYQDLKARYERVYVCGLSLGGILTVLLAGEFSPAGIILLAPAILNSDRKLLLTPIVRHFVRSVKGSYEAQGQDLTNPEIAYLAEEYWSRRWPGPAAELLALQRRSRRVLPKVTAPCLVVVSKGDRTVPPAVAGYIEGRISGEVETVVLEKSRHVLVTDSEKEKVADTVVDRIWKWETQGGGETRGGEPRSTPAEAPVGSPRRA
jgi:carboxylesterase